MMLGLETQSLQDLHMLRNLRVDHDLNHLLALGLQKPQTFRYQIDPLLDPRIVVGQVRSYCREAQASDPGLNPRDEDLRAPERNAQFNNRLGLGHQLKRGLIAMPKDYALPPSSMTVAKDTTDNTIAMNTDLRPIHRRLEMGKSKLPALGGLLGAETTSLHPTQQPRIARVHP